MALKVQARTFKYLIAAAGILGFALRSVLYSTGIDEKGLLVTGHWADSGCFLLTAAVAAVLFLWCRERTGVVRYTDAFPPSVLRAAGSAAAGFAILFSSNPMIPSPVFAVTEPVLRLVAAASLLFVGFCRLTGKKPLFLLHSCVCLYLGLRLIGQYRIWSVDPQMQNYCFYLGAHICLILACYQLTTFDADFGNHRKLWGIGLAAVYLSILSLANCEEPLFLLGCSFWIWTSLSNLTPPHRPKYAAPHHTDQEDSL